MTQTEREILASLTALDQAVKALRETGTKPDFQTIFGRLDRLTADLPSQTDPRLLHYLHKKSYEKARLFLIGRDAENPTGACLGD